MISVRDIQAVADGLAERFRELKEARGVVTITQWQAMLADPATADHLAKRYWELKDELGVDLLAEYNARRAP